MNTRDVLHRFIEEDLQGLLITDSQGRTLYADEKAAQVDHTSPNWQMACPPPVEGQRALEWELVPGTGQKAYLVYTSTVREEGQLLQVHLLTDVSMYHHLFRNISAYSKSLKEEKERDTLTGLFNKGKFLECKRSLFRNKDSITILNMDLNFLKKTNDGLGHEAGDRLIIKAARSIEMVATARNLFGFRLGGDEFMLVALHLSRQGAEQLFVRWQEALADLNRQEPDLPCSIACGMVFGEEGYDLDALLTQADALMYEDKKRKKGGRTD